MKNFGFIKVAAAIPSVKVGDCCFNAQQTLDLLRQVETAGVQIVVFPELGLTAYTCADLFGNALLLHETEQSLAWLLHETKTMDIVGIVGLPISTQNRTFNCAAAFHQGRILGIVPKTYLPNYNEFYEARWFASAADATAETVVCCGQTVPFSANILFQSSDATFAIELAKTYGHRFRRAAHTPCRAQKSFSTFRLRTNSSAKTPT